ncbi:uncharacterized protein Dana_GF27942, isoform A [Drosophila ananassae]|uniref:Uncharacterized protein, isoform A n=1 Tax=Drosophila ananassae TaxID=7217 RepID=A0A0P8Y1Y6_DROAN|nr:uncharacterized protein Dana_GF27942, isoform A [Drosophila ananassae]
MPRNGENDQMYSTKHGTPPGGSCSSSKDAVKSQSFSSPLPHVNPQGHTWSRCILRCIWADLMRRLFGQSKRINQLRGLIGYRGLR